MTTYDKARVERFKSSIEESLNFKFRMSHGFFIYKDRYFRTLWRMLAAGLEDTKNKDIVDTLSVPNGSLHCVANVMEKEREEKIEQFPEYAWYKEARNIDMDLKTRDINGSLVVTEPFTLHEVDLSIGDTIVVVKSSTGMPCGTIMFRAGKRMKSILPEIDLFPIGYTNKKTTIRFVPAISTRTYSTKSNIAYTDTKLFPQIKNGIIVGVLKKFVSSPSNEKIFAKIIASSPELINIKTFTINGQNPAHILTKHFDSIPPRVARDAISYIIDFYGGSNRSIPKVWQGIVLGENISVDATPKHIAIMRSSIDTIFEQESGFDVVLKDTGTGSIYRYTSVNKKKDIKKILSAMRRYTVIKDVLRKIPVLAQYSAAEKILDGKKNTSVEPQDHVYEIGSNKIWMDYDAGILSGTLNKPHSSALKKLLSPVSTNKKTLLESRLRRLGKLLLDEESLRLCTCTLAAMQVCMVMKIPFKIRMSEGTKYTRGAILSAMSSQSYMPIQLSLVNPREAKVMESSIAYGKEQDVDEYRYGVIFDDYKPDIFLSTEVPSASDRSITNTMRGVGIVSQHAFLVSEVFRLIASRYNSGEEAIGGMSSFDDILRVSEEVFLPLFEEIKNV